MAKKHRTRAKPPKERETEPRPAAFSYGSILEGWVARGEPTIFHKQVTANRRRRREAEIKETWRVR